MPSTPSSPSLVAFRPYLYALAAVDIAAGATIFFCAAGSPLFVTACFSVGAAGSIFALMFLLSRHDTKVADLKEKLAESERANLRLTADSENLREIVKAQQAAEKRSAQVCKADFRRLSLIELSGHIALARCLADDAEKVQECDNALLGSFSVLDQIVSMRRRDHGDVHKAILCFEAGDAPQLGTMLRGLLARHPVEYKAFMVRFDGAQSFFQRLVSPDQDLGSDR